MKRKRSSTPNQGRCNTLSAMRLTQISHEGCPLLQLPRELRVRILQHLLYSPEPLGMKFDVNNDRLKHLLVRPNKRTFTLYPAILCVSQQVRNEGYEILYRQNTTTATINLDPDDERSTVECLDNLIPFDDLGVAIASPNGMSPSSSI